MALLATLGWRGLDTLLRARANLSDQLERTRGMQLTFAQLQTDCAQLAAPAALAHRAPLVVSANRLLMVRRVLAEDQPSQLMVVAYRLRDGRLLRSASAPTRDLALLDRLWSATSDGTASAQQVVLQTGLAGMALRLWYADGAGWRAPGIDVYADSARPPDGLEITLAASGGSLRKLFLLGLL